MTLLLPVVWTVVWTAVKATAAVMVVLTQTMLIALTLVLLAFLPKRQVTAGTARGMLYPLLPRAQMLHLPWV